MTKFAKLENGNLIFAPQNKGAVLNYNLNIELMVADGFKQVIEAELPIPGREYTFSYIEDNSSIQEIINYLETQEEYDIRINNEQNELEIQALQSQIKDIDAKRIRAICEPSIKDEMTGETWLDFYNSQVVDLRGQIAELQGGLQNVIE